MNKEFLFDTAIIGIAGMSIAIADSLIKKSTIQASSLLSILKNPLMLIATLLYLLQIALFVYMFVKKWDLGMVGLIQMMWYAAVVIIVGVFFFQEKITLTHGTGMAIAILAVILMNL